MVKSHGSSSWKWQFVSKWNKFTYFVDFAYTNSDHAMVKQFSPCWRSAHISVFSQYFMQYPCKICSQNPSFISCISSTGMATICSIILLSKYHPIFWDDIDGRWQLRNSFNPQGRSSCIFNIRWQHIFFTLFPPTDIIQMWSDSAWTGLAWQFTMTGAPGDQRIPLGSYTTRQLYYPRGLSGAPAAVAYVTRHEH